MALRGMTLYNMAALLNHGKGLDMYQLGRKKGTVSFKISADGKAAKVAIAGDWNGWKPEVMKKQKDGSFGTTIELTPGRHEYKFILDGNWVADPDVANVAPNAFGSVNSVAVVK
jgi:1,4-alpha-glucan branching enzyme